MPPVAAAQQRLDRTAHAGFHQLVGQLVDMGVAAQNQLFACLEDIAHRHRPVAEAERLPLEAHLPAERVDEPGLAPRLLPHGLHRFGPKLLARLSRVLPQQSLDLGRVKSPRRSDSALMLKALPPVITCFYEPAWIR